MVKAVGRIDIYCVMPPRGYVYMVTLANADCLTGVEKNPLSPT